MLRAIASVIVGYIVMFIIVAGGLFVAFMAIGVEAAYKPGVWDASNLWLMVSFAVGLVAAILGGMVCKLIARSSTPPKVLAALVLILGLLMALPGIFMQKDAASATRPTDPSVKEIAENTKTPMIAMILNPIIGAVGVMIGAGMVGRKSATSV